MGGEHPVSARRDCGRWFADRFVTRVFVVPVALRRYGVYQIGDV
jgi:hypothetical protein